MERTRDVSRVFVYGTLMPGHVRWPMLEPLAVARRPASVPGRLYDTGQGWPAAVFTPGASEVQGVVVELEPVTAEVTLERLDEIEGTRQGQFRRVRIVTTAGAEAWAYSWNQPTNGLVPIDHWGPERPEA